MALKIRLQRGGTTHTPVYRIVVAENTARRDGRFVEILGNYAPKAKGNEMEYRLKLDRVEYWMSVGAKPTDTVRNLIRRVKRGETGESKQPSTKGSKKTTEEVVVVVEEQAETASPVTETPPAEEATPVAEKTEESAETTAS